MSDLPVITNWQMNLPKTGLVDDHETQTAPGAIYARGRNT
jgi:hypothetical protein